MTLDEDTQKAVDDNIRDIKKEVDEIEKEAAEKEKGKDKDKPRRKSRSRSRDKKKRSRSRDRKKRRSRSRSKRKSRSRSPKKRSRSRDKSRKSRRSRSRSKDKGPSKPLVRAFKTMWDIACEGFENMPVLEYKRGRETGTIAVPSMTPAAQVGGWTAQMTRHARRVYVGNTPFGITEELMVDFFNAKMKETNIVTQPGDPVVAVSINLEKNFAFVEFRSIEETANALAFDGIVVQGSTLRIRRPHDYNPAEVPGGKAVEDLHIPGVCSTFVPDTVDKVFVGAIPNYLSSDQVKELLTAFGELKAYNLVKDNASAGISKGYAFCEFADAAITDIAIAGLNGMAVADKRLIVQRHCLGTKNPMAFMTHSFGIPGVDLSQAVEPTNILCLMNMCTVEDLLDEEEYHDLLDDVRGESQKYGTLVSIKIPRPVDGKPDTPGVGKIYLEYSTSTDSRTASQALNGRKFANNAVLTAYYDPDLYTKDIWQ